MANEFKENLKILLKFERRPSTKANRKRSRKAKPKSWLYPSAIERKYWKEINKRVVTPLRKIAEPTLRNKLPNWLREASVFDHSDEYKIDTWVQELQELVDRLIEEQNLIFVGSGGGAAGSVAQNLIFEIADNVYAFNRKQWNKTVQAVAGFKFETPERWYESVKEAWAAENYQLLKNLDDSYISRLNEAVLRGVRNGQSVAEITREVKKIGRNISNARAKLIAEDQIGKLNGILTKRRQTEAGISIYIWNTAKDERVRGRPGGKYPNARPSHWAMEGMLCRWDNDSLYADPNTDVERDKTGSIVKTNWKPRTGKMPRAIPGEAIRCRCGAIPLWESFLQEVDEELEEENQL